MYHLGEEWNEIQKHLYALFVIQGVGQTSPLCDSDTAGVSPTRGVPNNRTANPQRAKKKKKSCARGQELGVPFGLQPILASTRRTPRHRPPWTNIPWKTNKDKLQTIIAKEYEDKDGFF